MKIIEGRVRVAASDVANFLACQQLTQLDLQKARGTLRPPPRETWASRTWCGAGRSTSARCSSGSGRTGTRWRTSPGHRTRPGRLRLPSAMGPG
jgi:hypothetical protein